MYNFGLHYPIFGPEIPCPHCRQTILALTLTDTYLCPRHGPFEADSLSNELVHLPSGRHWRRWHTDWHRQHTHPDGVRFEIHEALDELYKTGYKSTGIIIARRYQGLMGNHLEITPSQEKGYSLRLYGLPVGFSPDSDPDPCWNVINFSLEKEYGTPTQYPSF